MNDLIILNVLCEGQTEERFAKELLKPYLQERGITVKHRLLITSRKKNQAGGMLSYTQVKNDLTIWIKEVCHRSHERHYFTTMFDFYALPNSFPGWKDAQAIRNKQEAVKTIEEAFAKDLGYPDFIPYIQLHEFEALLFCDLDKLLIDYPDCPKEIEQLKNDLRKYDNNPEAIDNNPATAPSKRIGKALEKKYKYNKTKSGITVTQAIGINELRKKCAHFNEWLELLEKIK